MCQTENQTLKNDYTESAVVMVMVMGMDVVMVMVMVMVMVLGMVSGWWIRLTFRFN